MDGQKGNGKHIVSQEDETWRGSIAQWKALREARMYEIKIPNEIQQQVNDAENRLWDEFDKEIL